MLPRRATEKPSSSSKSPPDLKAVVGPLSDTDKPVIDDVKRRARGDLAVTEWAVRGWASDPTALVEPPQRGQIAVENAARLSVADFRARYELPLVPCIIQGCTDDWPAQRGAWEPHNLLTAYRDRRFKVGEDDDGYPVKLPLHQFLRYAAHQRDDSPYTCLIPSTRRRPRGAAACSLTIECRHTSRRTSSISSASIVGHPTDGFCGDQGGVVLEYT